MRNLGRQEILFFEAGLRKTGTTRVQFALQRLTPRCRDQIIGQEMRAIKGDL